MTTTYYKRPIGDTTKCECPKNHAHTYPGACEWALNLAGGKHLCKCVNPVVKKFEPATLPPELLFDPESTP